MKKLALAFSSKDRVELTEQSLSRVTDRGIQLFWNDGSATDEGKRRHQCNIGGYDGVMRTRVTGGPDRAIVFALSQMLADPTYTHVGLLENDVLLDPDWLEPTMALFDKEGLPVGAVSARSFEDRVLIQRDGYAVMHNVGAGHVIFTREAAEIALNFYRNGWWPENRRVFSQISGIDIGKFGAFGLNEQPTTVDWSWDTILASHGLATLALTPSRATMIGQNPPLEQQGLRLVEDAVEARRDDLAFERYRESLLNIRDGRLTIPGVDHNLHDNRATLTFPHQVGKHRGRYGGQWKTRWSQGFGPFLYVAQAEASLTIPAFGTCVFHVGGGHVRVHDTVTGFDHELDLTGQNDMVAIPVPRDKQFGKIELTFGPGAMFFGFETSEPQPTWDVRFDYNSLPETM